MMRYLLDTNIFLFWIYDKDMLSREVLDILYDYGNNIYMSAASVQETINLQQSGAFITRKKQPLASGVVNFIETETSIEIKPIQREHLKTLDSLPMLKDHKDPFDRMIIAHAMTEKDMVLISSDTKFPHYTRYGLSLIFNPK